MKIRNSIEDRHLANAVQPVPHVTPLLINEAPPSGGALFAGRRIIRAENMNGGERGTNNNANFTIQRADSSYPQKFFDQHSNLIKLLCQKALINAVNRHKTAYFY
jgi:hypothetical protein